MIGDNQVLVLYNYIDASLKLDFYKSYYPLFPDCVIEKIVNYQKKEDKITSIVGKYLLLYGLKKMRLSENIDSLNYTNNKRPYLRELPQVDFNISHTKGLVLCVLSSRIRIGVDVEKMETVNLHNFKNQFSSIQWECINNSSNPLHLFYRYWVQKEAIVKADGVGLAHSFSDIEIIFDRVVLNKHTWFLKAISINKDYCSWLASSEHVEIRLEEVQFL